MTIITVFLGVWLAGCRPTIEEMPTAVPVPAIHATETAVSTKSPIPTPQNHTTNVAAKAAPPTLTPIPTTIATETPAATDTPTATPTATPIPSCIQRAPPPEDLFPLVSLTYGLSREYTPPNLVPLGDYFPVEVTLGYPSELRQEAVEPLVDMVTAMQDAGLAPMIISGYRSYYSQNVAYAKWLESNPASASIVSAPPGHSEHQLGTVVDFGSPELAEVVGEEDIEFHTYFFKTSEGAWLLDNAQRYGFTLSFTREAFEVTGLYYEPWHYRYVGVEMATQLKEMGLTLTEYLLQTQPEPCIPETE